MGNFFRFLLEAIFQDPDGRFEFDRFATAQGYKREAQIGGQTSPLTDEQLFARLPSEEELIERFGGKEEYRTKLLGWYTNPEVELLAYTDQSTYNAINRASPPPRNVFRQAHGESAGVKRIGKKRSELLLKWFEHLKANPHLIDLIGTS